MDVGGESIEERCARLELENRKWKSDHEELEAKFRALEAEKRAIQEEVAVLRRKNELKEQSYVIKNEENVNNYLLGEHEDKEEGKVLQLMIENKVLECERNKAEKDLKLLRQKFEELESWVQAKLVMQGGPQILEGNTLGVEIGQEVSGRKIMGNLKDSRDELRDTQATNFIDVGSQPDGITKETSNLDAAGTTPDSTLLKNTCDVKEEKEVECLKSKLDHQRQVRKQLLFEDGESLCRKMTPSTPGVAKSCPVDVIDIDDSDDELDRICDKPSTPQSLENSKPVGLTDCMYGGSMNRGNAMSFEYNSRMCHEGDYGDNMDGDKEDLSTVLTPKRKRASNVVKSDNESDSDDLVPICKLKRAHIQELPSGDTSYMNWQERGRTPVRRRLMTLRKCEAKLQAQRKSTSGAKHHRGIPAREDSEEQEDEDSGSDCESDNLSSFIVDDSDVSLDDAASDEDHDSGQSGDTLDGDTDYAKILSKIQRRKDHRSEWKFEADMLADFGKDPELCMKAVCVLYRFQTDDERSSKNTFYTNRRGFSKFDAPRGCALGEFLTDGDPGSGLKKSVEELEKYNPKAPELCRSFANRYSKQLFQIYQNKEDPFFSAS